MIKQSKRFFYSLLSLKNKITGGILESLQEKPDVLSMLINAIILNKLHNIQTARTVLHNYRTQENVTDFPVEEIAPFL